MASKILLGKLFGTQWKIDLLEFEKTYSNSAKNRKYKDNKMAIIAKGNIIEGIEAKE